MSEAYLFQPHQSPASAHSWESPDSTRACSFSAGCDCLPHDDSQGDPLCPTHNLAQACEYAEWLKTHGDDEDRAENAAEIAYWRAVVVADDAEAKLARLGRNRHSLMNTIAMDETRDELKAAQETAARLRAAWLKPAASGKAAA